MSLGGFRGPVIAFIAAISLMVGLAGASVVGGAPTLLGIGALGFTLSDLSVARDRFVAAGLLNVAWGLPTYYLSQLAIAYAASHVTHAVGYSWALYQFGATRRGESVQTGRCYCGGVRYALGGDLGPVANCHCRNCRLVHGAAFSTVALVSDADLRVTSGGELVREYQTGTGSRFFCDRCGGRLFNRNDSRPGLTALVVATLDEEPTALPLVHINVESKAPWYEILDDLPRFETLPPNISDNSKP